VLNQPGGRDLDQAVGRREMRDLSDSPGRGGRLDAGELGGGDHRVGEEGARAAGVGVAGVEDHALAAADLNDGGADLPGARLLPHGQAKLGRQLRVADGRGKRLPGEAERHVKYEVPRLAGRG